MSDPSTAPVKTNDFVIKFANVNGSGSASANGMFAKAVFRMGIPVSPRNIFPSNIQGAPTWYEVRVNQNGYLGRRGGAVDLMIAVNSQSLPQDIVEVTPGGYLLYDNSYPIETNLIRDDIHYLGIPLTTISNENFVDPRQRMLFKNILYVGALAYLLNLDYSILHGVVSDMFAAKKVLIEANLKALNLGLEAAKELLGEKLPLQLAKGDWNKDKIMIEGNAACALGALYAGATVAAWYPITPSTSVAEAFERYAKKYRLDADTGEQRFAVIQAEDELSAIGMVIGAAWNGVRAFTATSGPGVSLMNELLGLAYFAEVPTVLFDVQRAGPSTGMPTRTQQSDLLISAYASHGDTKHILIIPSTPTECFELTADAFDIADQLQTPVIMMTDLELGMNEQICDAMTWEPQRSYDRGKVLDAAALDKIERYGRYLDVDGDGITYRTIPGTHADKGAFFNRGTSRTEYAVYTESGAEYEKNMRRLSKKWNTAIDYVPKPVICQRDKKAEVGILHFGTSLHATHEAIDLLRENGVIANDLRIRAIPFNQEVKEFIEQHSTLFVVEQNRDAQMKTLLVNELEIDPKRLQSVLHFNGDPISAKTVCDEIQRQLCEDRNLYALRRSL